MKKQKRTFTQLDAFNAIRKEICPFSKIIPPVKGKGAKYKRIKRIDPE